MLRFLRDLSQATRLLRQSPGLASVIVVTLALGVGANSSIFSLLDQILVRTLPVPQPEQLSWLSGPGPNSGWITSSSDRVKPLSQPMYASLRRRNEVFEDMAARYPTPLHVSIQGEAEQVEGSLVSGSFFEVLGVASQVGRLLLSADEGEASAPPEAVLSDAYWRGRFGGDPGVVGQTIEVNGQSLVVIGVAAVGFRGVDMGRAADLWVPLLLPDLVPPSEGIGNRRIMWLEVFGRRLPTVSDEAVATAMNVLYRQELEGEAKELADKPQSFLDRFVAKRLEIIPGGQGMPDLRTQLRTPLLVLMAMVGLVVLIACANVANLLLARASARQREIAIRLALGASRRELASQQLAEALLLSALGAAGGLLVSSWTTGLLLQALPFAEASKSFSAAVDWRVAAFAAALALATAVLISLVPVVQGIRPELAASLKDRSATAAGAGPLRLRKILVVAQVALSALLLVGAGLFARSLANLQEMSPGFRKDGLMSFSIDPMKGGRSRAQSLQLFASLRQELLALPGVRSVSMASEALMTNSHWGRSVTAEGYEPGEEEDVSVEVNAVGPTFFATLDLPLIAGRELDDRDVADRPEVVVVSEAFAHYFFGDENPIGRRIGWGHGNAVETDIEIVGLARDARLGDLRDEIRRTVYLPYAQSEDEQVGLTYYLLADGDLGQLVEPVRQLVRRLDPGVPVVDLSTMQATVAQALFVERIVAALSAAFGLLATLLAAIGLFGVMSYAVARRTREIGVRSALGANRVRILRLVLGEVALLAGLGIAIGLPSGWGLGRLVQGTLFGLTALDLPTLSGTVVVLSVVSLLAGFLPAWRAARVDPVTALQYE